MAKWEGDLKKEADAEMRILMNAFEDAAWDALAETKERLKSHIKADVYDKWDPTTYERRGENGGLIDIENNTRTNEPWTETQGNAIGAAFVFQYLPDGSSSQWEIPYHNSVLIKRIETGEGYEWRKHPGPRPFWSNLVKELIDENGYGDVVLRKLQMLGIEIEGSLQVERSQSGNGEY